MKVIFFLFLTLLLVFGQSADNGISAFQLPGYSGYDLEISYSDVTEDSFDINVAVLSYIFDEEEKKNILSYIEEFEVEIRDEHGELITACEPQYQEEVEVGDQRLVKHYAKCHVDLGQRNVLSYILSATGPFGELTSTDTVRIDKIGDEYAVISMPFIGIDISSILLKIKPSWSSPYCIPTMILLALIGATFYARGQNLFVGLMDVLTPKLPRPKPIKYSMTLINTTFYKKETFNRQAEAFQRMIEEIVGKKTFKHWNEKLKDAFDLANEYLLEQRLSEITREIDNLTANDLRMRIGGDVEETKRFLKEAIRAYGWTKSASTAIEFPSATIPVAAVVMTKLVDSLSKGKAVRKRPFAFTPLRVGWKLLAQTAVKPLFALGGYIHWMGLTVAKKEELGKWSKGVEMKELREYVREREEVQKKFVKEYQRFMKDFSKEETFKFLSIFNPLFWRRLSELQLLHLRALRYSAFDQIDVLRLTPEAAREVFNSFNKNVYLLAYLNKVAEKDPERLRRLAEKARDWFESLIPQSDLFFEKEAKFREELVKFLNDSALDVPRELTTDELLARLEKLGYDVSGFVRGVDYSERIENVRDVIRQLKLYELIEQRIGISVPPMEPLRESVSPILERAGIEEKDRGLMRMLLDALLSMKAQFGLYTSNEALVDLYLARMMSDVEAVFDPVAYAGMIGLPLESLERLANNLSFSKDVLSRKAGELLWDLKVLDEKNEGGMKKYLYSSLYDPDMVKYGMYRETGYASERVGKYYFKHVLEEKILEKAVNNEPLTKDDIREIFEDVARYEFEGLSDAELRQKLMEAKLFSDKELDELENKAKQNQKSLMEVVVEELTARLWLAVKRAFSAKQDVIIVPTESRELQVNVKELEKQLKTLFFDFSVERQIKYALKFISSPLRRLNKGVEKALDKIVGEVPPYLSRLFADYAKQKLVEKQAKYAARFLERLSTIIKENVKNVDFNSLSLGEKFEILAYLNYLRMGEDYKIARRELAEQIKDDLSHIQIGNGTLFSVLFGEGFFTSEAFAHPEKAGMHWNIFLYQRVGKSINELRGIYRGEEAHFVDLPLIFADKVDGTGDYPRSYRVSAWTAYILANRGFVEKSFYPYAAASALTYMEAYANHLSFGTLGENLRHGYNAILNLLSVSKFVHEWLRAMGINVEYNDLMLDQIYPIIYSPEENVCVNINGTDITLPRLAGKLPLIPEFFKKVVLIQKGHETRLLPDEKMVREIVTSLPELGGRLKYLRPEWVFRFSNPREAVLNFYVYVRRKGRLEEFKEVRRVRPAVEYGVARELKEKGIHLSDETIEGLLKARMDNLIIELAKDFAQQKGLDIFFPLDFLTLLRAGELPSLKQLKLEKLIDYLKMTEGERNNHGRALFLLLKYGLFNRIQAYNFAIPIGGEKEKEEFKRLLMDLKLVDFQDGELRRLCDIAKATDVNDDAQLINALMKMREEIGHWMSSAVSYDELALRLVEELSPLSGSSYVQELIGFVVSRALMENKFFKIYENAERFRKYGVIIGTYRELEEGMKSFLSAQSTLDRLFMGIPAAFRSMPWLILGLAQIRHGLSFALHYMRMYEKAAGYILASENQVRAMVGMFMKEKLSSYKTRMDQIDKEIKRLRQQLRQVDKRKYRDLINQINERIRLLNQEKKLIMDEFDEMYKTLGFGIRGLNQLVFFFSTRAPHPLYGGLDPLSRTGKVGGTFTAGSGILKPKFLTEFYRQLNLPEYSTGYPAWSWSWQSRFASEKVTDLVGFPYVTLEKRYGFAERKGEFVLKEYGFLGVPDIFVHMWEAIGFRGTLEGLRYGGIWFADRFLQPLRQWQRTINQTFVLTSVNDVALYLSDDLKEFLLSAFGAGFARSKKMRAAKHSTILKPEYLAVQQDTKLNLNNIINYPHLPARERLMWAAVYSRVKEVGTETPQLTGHTIYMSLFLKNFPINLELGNLVRPFGFTFASTLVPAAIPFVGAFMIGSVFFPYTMQKFYERALYWTRKWRGVEGLGLGDIEERYLAHRPHLTFTWLSSTYGAYPNLPGISRKDLLAGVELLDQWMARRVASSSQYGDVDRLHTSVFDRYLEIKGDPLGFEPEYNWAYLFLHPSFVAYFTETTAPIHSVFDTNVSFIYRKIAKSARLAFSLTGARSRLVRGIGYIPASFGILTGALGRIASVSALGTVSTVVSVGRRLAGHHVVCPVCGAIKPRGAPCFRCGFRSTSSAL